MSLFTPNTTPIFLKEDSDTTQHIARLKELQEKATGKVKDDIVREITFASYGEAGEKNIAFELKSAGIPMYIIHDLHLQHEDLTAQIDFVVVTRKLVFFIECKNLYGNIAIDNQGNFVRSYLWNGRTVKDGIYSPITQNQRHLEIFRQINLAKTTNPIKRLGFEKNFDNFYRSIVVLANPKTVLNAKYAKKDVKNKVIRADQLIAYIKEQNKQSKELACSEKGLKAWAEKILSHHQPLSSDYTQKYETILSGLTESSQTFSTEAPVAGQVRPSVRESAAKAYTVTSPQNDELVAKLKAFRRETSRKENVQAYVVFNDRQLDDLIIQKPETLVELQRISGFGPVKTEKYGPGILALIKSGKVSVPSGNQTQNWTPAQLISEKIMHQTFGPGTIKSVGMHEIVIQFRVSARNFDFPTVFDKDIQMSNPVLQKKVEGYIKAQKELKADVLT
ncbi:hypothetical protein GH808_00650 [Acetobacterium fimetarium]|uniref:HRDC domain-containing protein n=1 Tax=Acetobacterium fimetarium TaxID=52691 RepID=A0ABR6WR25_9FIRM|nr:NERD domain-containing protein [Acetobacterium fimetarium]MBC3802952.1 hypothetical protein [Acetobacterium fimetarium]